jgi:hypothetical protein
VTEDQARTVLAAFVAVGNVERWIAEQPWEPLSRRGWRVRGELHGWRFQVKPARSGVRVILHTAKGERMAWIVPAK